MSAALLIVIAIPRLSTPAANIRGFPAQPPMSSHALHLTHFEGGRALSPFERRRCWRALQAVAPR
jgi:hypothetical protein